ncbi:MAG: hypothetical protein QKU97_gp1 [Yunnan mymona-like virus 1]|uniref:Nucleocapsid protein n=1 Tax=Yunnan mymona-like virus 1 TaxID=2824522 RepID=A0AAX1PBH5_9MONO|nr:MAG: hypothetical protein QKU97_gp1 [Yunnan mymona-like virus 1]QYK37508.1 MAG: hypothetical protein [Yunnan mymona-like virus 1]
MATETVTAPDDLVKFWEDDNTAVTNVKLLTIPPQIEPPSLGLQLVTGGHETLLFLALQIERTRDKSVALRAIASAVGILFSTSRDMTGGTAKPVTLDKLDEEGTDVSARDLTEEVGANFAGGEKITAAELLPFLGDLDELASYYGVLFMAGIKRATPKNLDAFNKNRRQNVKSTVNQELVLFTESNPLLAKEVLDTVYAAFNVYLPNRMFLVRETAKLAVQVQVGAALSFSNMFVLLEDAGMGSLRIIKEAVIKYPWIRAKFPELQVELNAANKAQSHIRSVLLTERPFAKAIYGNKFVPVSQAEIANLLGVCKRIMLYSVATYANFDGGKYTERQEEIIQEMMEPDSDAAPVPTA